MFLHELLRLDGRAGICEPAVDGHEKMCTKCSVVPPTIRCEDCYGGQLYCTACTVQIHRSNPFHRIEVRTSPLSIVTYAYRIKHSVGMACFSRQQPSSQLGFVFSWDTLTTSGVQTLKLLPETPSL